MNLAGHAFGHPVVLAHAHALLVGTAEEPQCDPLVITLKVRHSRKATEIDMEPMVLTIDSA